MMNEIQSMLDTNKTLAARRSAEHIFEETKKYVADVNQRDYYYFLLDFFINNELELTTAAQRKEFEAIKNTMLQGYNLK